MKSNTREISQKYKTVAILFNTWFGESIGSKLKNIRTFLKNNDDNIARYCDPLQLEKLKHYYNEFETFRRYWYTNQQIEDYNEPFEWFELFAEDSYTALEAVLEHASKIEKKWLKSRIQHPDHRCEQLKKIKLNYLNKMENIGVYDCDLSFIDEDDFE